MTTTPSRRKTEKASSQSSAISIPDLDTQRPAALTPMNFRVPETFHREFKLYAVQHGISMVDLLQKSFRLMKEKQAR